MSKDNEILNNSANNSVNKLNVSLSLIQTARSQKRTKALSVYYFLKSTFRNSCIYAYKSRMQELADSLGICNKTLYNYIDHLRRLGLVYDHANNLMLTSTKAVKSDARERKKCQITITDKEDIKTIESRLMGKLIETHVKRISLHKAMRSFEKRDQDKKTVGENATSISQRNLQKVLQLSQVKTKNLVRTLNDLGVIRTTRNKPKFMAHEFPPLKYSEEFPGYWFRGRDEGLFVLFGDKHEMLEYPVQIKKLSYRQYLTIYKRMNCKKRYNS